MTDLTRREVGFNYGETVGSKCVHAVHVNGMPINAASIQVSSCLIKQRGYISDSFSVRISRFDLLILEYHDEYQTFRRIDLVMSNGPVQSENDRWNSQVT